VIATAVLRNLPALHTLLVHTRVVNDLDSPLSTCRT